MAFPICPNLSSPEHKLLIEFTGNTLLSYYMVNNPLMVSKDGGIEGQIPNFLESKVIEKTTEEGIKHEAVFQTVIGSKVSSNNSLPLVSFKDITNLSNVDNKDIFTHQMYNHLILEAEDNLFDNVLKEFNSNLNLDFTKPIKIASFLETINVNGKYNKLIDLIKSIKDYEEVTIEIPREAVDVYGKNFSLGAYDIDNGKIYFYLYNNIVDELINKGLAINKEGELKINKKFNKYIETMLHEVIHVVTIKALRVEENTEDWEKVKHIVEPLTKLYNYLKEQPQLKERYASKNIEEFIAESMSNKELQRLLADIKIPDEFQINGSTNFFDWLFEQFKKWFNWENSALTSIIKGTNELTQVQLLIDRNKYKVEDIVIDKLNDNQITPQQNIEPNKQLTLDFNNEVTVGQSEQKRINVSEAIEEYKQELSKEYFIEFSLEEVKEISNALFSTVSQYYIGLRDLDKSIKLSKDAHESRYQITDKILNNELTLDEAKKRFPGQFININTIEELEKVNNYYKILFAEENKNKLDLLLKTSAKSLKFLSSVEEEFEEANEDEALFEKYYGSNRQYLDFGDKISSGLRLFLSDIIEIKDGKVQHNILKLPKTIDYEKAFKDLRALFANKKPTWTNFEQLLLDNQNYNSLYKDVYNKIKRLETQGNKKGANQREQDFNDNVLDYIEKIKRDIVEGFGLTAENNLTILVNAVYAYEIVENQKGRRYRKTDERLGTQYTVINSNAGDGINQMMNLWKNNINIRVSTHELNKIKLETEKNTILNRIINEGFTTDIQIEMLRLMGITFDDNAIIQKLLENKFKNITLSERLFPFLIYQANEQIDKSIPIFAKDKNGISYQVLNNTLFLEFYNDLINKVSDINETNPYDTKNENRQVLRSVANEALRYIPIIYGDNFLNINGTKQFVFQQYTHENKWINTLKSDMRTAVKLGQISIAKDSLLLADLIKNPDEIQFTYFNGIKPRSAFKGTARKEASRKQSDIIAFNLLTKGMFLDITHSDRHLSPVLKWKNFDIGNIIIDDNGAITDIENSIMSLIEKQYMAEVNRINIFLLRVKNIAANKGIKNYYTKNANKFHIFSILNYENITQYITPEERNIVYNKDKSINLSNESKNILRNVMKQSLLKEINKTLNYWKATELINGRNTSFDYNFMKGRDTDSTKNVNRYNILEKPLESAAYAAAFYVLNYAIFYGESIRILHNDPAHAKSFDDFQKRASREGATSKSHYYIKDNINVITVNDRMVDSDMVDYYNKTTKTTGYSNINSTDGFEIGSFGELIENKFAHNQIPYSIYKSLKAKYKESIENKSYYFELSDKEKTYIYQVDKPVLIDNIIDLELDTVQPIYRKSSIIYLIPELTKGTEWDKIRLFIENNKIDRLAVESADKYGARKVYTLFDKNGKVINTERTDVAEYIYPIPQRDGLGIQQDVPPKSIYEINIATQLNKLLFEGLLNETFNFEGQEVKGQELKNIKEQIIKDIFRIKRNHLFKDMGIKFVANSIRVVNVRKFQKWIERLGINQDWTPSQLASIQLNETGLKFKYPLRYNMFAQQIEYAIMAKLKKELINIKLPGTSSIQVPNIGMDINPNIDNKAIVFLDTFNNKEPLKYVSENNRIVQRAQVILSWNFVQEVEGKLIPIPMEQFITNGKIDTTKMPKELLDIIGFRIPTQDHSNSVILEVVGFIPKYMGNIMIVNDEIVTQMGSDFDIDKIYSYIKKYLYKENEQKIYVVNENLKKEFSLKQLTKTKRTLELNQTSDINEINKLTEDILFTQKIKYVDILRNRYIDVINTILSHPTTIKKSLRPLDKDDLKLEAEKYQREFSDSITFVNYQIDSYINQQIGQDLIAISSLFDTFNALVQGYEIYLKDKERNSIIIEIAGLKLNRINGLGKSKYNNEDRTISDNITIAQSLFVDYAKSPIGKQLNLNGITAPIAMFIAMLSTEENQSLAWDNIIEFIKTKEIEEYVNNKLEGIKTNEETEDSINLVKFKQLETLTSEFLKIRKAIVNISTKGAGKSLIEATYYKRIINELPLSSFEGIEKLLGVFNTEEAFSDLKFTFPTELGYLLKETLDIVEFISNEYFGYNNHNVKKVINTIIALENKSPTIDKLKEILTNYTAFVYSGFINNISVKSIETLREELLSGKTSISGELYQILEKYPILKKNKFLSKLVYEKGNGFNEIDTITTIFSEKHRNAYEMSLAFADLLIDKRPDVKQLAINLLMYPFLTGNVNGAITFFDRIDSRILDKLGFDVFLNTIDESSYVYSFIRQFYQNNINDATYVNTEKDDVQTIEGGIKILKNGTTAKWMKIVDNISYIQNNFKLYELTNSEGDYLIYKEISRLGSKDMKEYNYYNDYLISILKGNRSANIETTLPLLKSKLDTSNIVQSTSLDYVQYEGKIDTVLQSIESEPFKTLAKVFSAYEKSDLPVVINPQLESRGLFTLNRIEVNPSRFYKSKDKFEMEEVLLHEVGHNILNKVFEKPEEKLNDIERKFVNRINELRNNAISNLRILDNKLVDELLNIPLSTTNLPKYLIRFSGLRSNQEFINEMMTNGEFQKEMNNSKTDKSNNILQKFLQYFLDFIKEIGKTFKIVVKADSILHETILTTFQFFEDNLLYDVNKGESSLSTTPSIFSLRHNVLSYTNGQIEALKLIENNFKNIKRVVDNIKLKNNQYVYKDYTINIIPPVLIAGYAGTGKTTILENIVNYAILNNYSVNGMALSNKVANRIDNVSKETIKPFNASTIHKFLYVPKLDKNDNLRFEPKHLNASYEDSTIIVIDEIGMVHYDELMEIFMFAAKTNSRIIMFGDERQLKPIVSESAPDFVKEFDIFNYKTIIENNNKIQMKEVTRTKNKDILRLATAMRVVNKPVFPSEFNDTIQQMNETQLEETYYNDIRLINSTNSSVSSVYLTTTNARRIEVNKHLHKSLYSNDFLNENEPIVFINNGLYSNSEFGKVSDYLNMENYNIKPIKLNTKYGMYFANLFTLKKDILPINPNYPMFIFVPEMNQPSLYHSSITGFLTTNGEILTNEFEEFKSLIKRNIIPSIFTFGYAMTVNKAQGAEFDNVYIDYKKYQSMTEDSMTSGYYTALTRAKKKVYFCKMPYMAEYVMDNNEIDKIYEDNLAPITNNVKPHPIVDIEKVRNEINRNLFSLSPSVIQDDNLENLSVNLKSIKNELINKIVAGDSVVKVLINDYINQINDQLQMLEDNQYNEDTIRRIYELHKSFIEEIIAQDKSHATNLRYGLILTDMWNWDNIINYISEETLNDNSSSLLALFKEISSEMKVLNTKLINKSQNFILDEANTKTRKKDNKGNLVEFQLNDILRVQNINLLKGEALDISHIDHPLIQSISKYLTNATTLAESQLLKVIKDIQYEWGLVKDMPEIKNNILLHTNKKGINTGRLVGRYTGEFYTTMRDFWSKLNEGLKAIPIENKQERKNYILQRLWDNDAGLMNKVEIIDVRFFITENYSTKDFKSKEEYIKYLEEQYGKAYTDEVIIKAINRNLMYENDRKGLFSYWASNMGDAEALQQRIDYWSKQNNPIELLEKIDKRDLADAQVINPLNKYHRLVMIPKNKNNYYDVNFRTIENNEKLFRFYSFYTHLMDELLNYLPASKTKNMTKESLARIKQDFITELLSDNFKGGLKALSQQLLKVVTIESEPSLLSSQEDNLNINRDVLTGQIINTIPVKYTGDFNEEIHSLNLPKILEAFAAMALNYKHKSNIEDIVKLQYRILEEAVEVTKTSRNTLIRDKDNRVLEVKKGAIRLKETVKYAIDGILYNKKRLDSEGDTGVMLFGWNFANNVNPFSKDWKRKSVRIKELKSQLLNAEWDYDNNEMDKTDYDTLRKNIDIEYKQIKGRNLDVNKTIDAINHFTQLKGLGLSITSGIANLSFGLFSNIIHSYGKVDFTPNEVYKALAYTLGHMKHSDNNKLYNLLMKYNVLFEINEFEYGKSQFNEYKLVSKVDFMIIQRRTEFINQAMSMMAMMLHKQVFVVEENKELSVWDIYNTDGSIKYNSLKSQFEVEGLEATDDNEFLRFRNKIIQVNKLIHGNYNPNDLVKIKSTSLGRALMIFRSWIAEGFNQRFQDYQYDDRLERYVEGRYRTVFNIGLLKSIGIMSKALVRNKNAYEDLNETQTENMRKTLAEMVGYLALLGLAVGLKHLWDDDDEDRPIAVNLLLNNMYRVRQDVWFFIEPTTFANIIRDPVPAIKTFGDLGKAIDASIDYISGDDFTRRKSPLRRWAEAMPLTSSYTRLETQSEKLYEDMIK